ncbi:MAG TPA: arylsulfatase, partial [Gemmataceae bacterium]
LTPNGGAIRKGDWKLVVGGKRTELFNIAKDPYEKRNLAEEHPEKVKELQQRLDAYAKEAVAPKSKPKAEDFKVPKVWGEPE